MWVNKDTREIIIPDDITVLGSINGFVIFGITTVDDVGNESDMAYLPPLRLDSNPPDTPQNVIVEGF